MERFDEKGPLITLEMLRDGYLNQVNVQSHGKHREVKIRKMSKKPGQIYWLGNIPGNLDRNGIQREYRLSIYLYPTPGGPHPNSFTRTNCAVRCNCADFEYRCVANLMSVKALYGRPQNQWKQKGVNVVVPPEKRARMCKHLIAFVRALAESGEISDWYLKQGM